MKKIFTLIAMAFVAISVNAQRLTFMGALQASYEKDGFKLEYVDTDGKLATDDSKSNNFGTADAYEKIEGCLKTGGKSGSKNNMTLTIPADGTLKVYVRTGSNSATDRNLVLTQNETELYNKVVQETDKVEVGDVSVYPIISVSVKAGTVAVTYPVGSLNFFAFELVAGGGGSVETLDITSVLEQTYVEEAEKYKYTKFAEGKITSVANTSPNNKGVGTKESPLPKETDDATAFSQAVPVELTDYLLKVSTTSVEMSLVSTPNANDNTAANAWAISDQTDGNNALSTDACNPKFNVYVSPKGNPTATYFGYWVYNNDGAPSFKCPNEYQTFWTPEVGAAPSKVAFTSIKISQAGSLKIGVRIQKKKKNRKVYFVKQSDGTILAQDQYNAEGYDNNNGNEYTVHTTTDYVVATDVNNQFIGYINVTLPVNETYVMFSPDTQIGIYGFQFTPGGSTNIETVKNKVWNPNAPMYNLSGQKVDKSYKGIVIQNGRKFVNK